MNKREIILKVSKNKNVDYNFANGIINEFLDIISNELIEGREVPIKNFGTFLVRQRKPDTWLNKNTNQLMQRVYRKEIGFKPSSILRGQGGVVECAGAYSEEE